MSDEQANLENTWYPRREWAIHVFFLLMAMVANLIVNQQNGGVSVNLTGAAGQQENDVLMRSLLHIFFTYNVMGFFIGSFLAMLPIGGKPYSQRYGRLSWLSMIAVQVFFLAWGIWA